MVRFDHFNTTFWILWVAWKRAHARNLFTLGLSLQMWSPTYTPGKQTLREFLKCSTKKSNLVTGSCWELHVHDGWGYERIPGRPCPCSWTISHIPARNGRCRDVCTREVYGRCFFFRLYPTTSSMALRCVEHCH